MRKLVLILAVMAVSAAPVQASIPPPAEPPDTLPETIAGYSAYEIWRDFSQWMRFELRARIDRRADFSLPSRYDRDGGRVLERSGPHLRFTSNFHNMRFYRYERMCESNGEACSWQVRSIRAPELEDIDSAARAVFDHERISARISEMGLEEARQDAFGLLDQAYNALDDIILERVIGQDACAAISTNLTAMEQLGAVPLDPRAASGQPLLSFVDPLPEPYPPFGASFTFTFPLDAYPDVDGAVVIQGGATAEMLALSSVMESGLWECFDG
ncbi:MAG: hypothetical protein GYB36_02020 [Alphaproteobacteria bacterium]|nr:hypothetical protein [Alphaproteobacteria bacterium]